MIALTLIQRHISIRKYTALHNYACARITLALGVTDCRAADECLATRQPCA